MLTSLLKQTCRYSVLYHFKRSFHESQPHAEIIADSLGVPVFTAAQYAHKHKLYNTNPESIMDSIKMCKELGYTNEEIYDNPGLIKTNCLTLDHRYLLMQEGGFDNISAHVLVKGRSHMKKMISELKMLHLIAKNTNVRNSFISYIDPIPDGFKVGPTKESMQWNSVQKMVLKEFLKRRLNASEDDIIKLFRVHKVIAYKSLRIVQENIALATELGFTPQKILSCGYILHNYPKYTKTVLKEFSDLAGSNMRVAMRRHPKLFMVSPKNYIKIYGILKQFEIPDETIRNHMNIFQLAPETVRVRLEEIQKIPELSVLFQNPYILSLVLHHKRAKNRLSFLQQLQLKCADVSVLGKQYEFDDHIREGKDINRRSDTYKFLSDLFKVNTEIIRRRWKLHPYSLQVPFINMKETFEHLKKLDFQTKDIYDCMHIILYPVGKINTAIKLISEKNNKFKDLTKLQQLNLILYQIEKEHHFTGNGIWQKYEISDTPDKVLE